MKIRGNILRVYKDLHTWVGISSGIFLFICFFAGALSMFKPTIKAWSTPLEQQLTGIPLEELETKLPALTQQYPSLANGFTVQLKHHLATLSWFATPVGRRVALDVPQHQAGLDQHHNFVVQQQIPSHLDQLIDQLHRTAGIPGTVGHESLGVLVMGVVSILYFVALISGLILLLPTLIKDFFAIRQRSTKRFWLDIHNLLGLTSFPFHIIISLTVIGFAFHDIFYDLLDKVVYEQPTQFSAGLNSTPQAHQVTPLPLTTLLNKAQQAAPDQTIHAITLSGMNSPRAMARIQVYSDNHYSRGATGGFVALDPYSGAIKMSAYIPGQGSTWIKVVNSFFALHFGSYGGVLIKWVYFFLGIAGAIVFYSGNLLWLESHRKRQTRTGLTPPQSRASRIMAGLTIGTCLGSIAGVATAMIIGKWLQSWATNINDWYIASYYLVFLGYVGFCLLSGAGRYRILLYLTALLALFIPLSNVLNYVLRSTGGNTPYVLSVDIVACCCALLFFYLAKRHTTETDSVWTHKVR